MENAIEIKKLCKSYQDFALSDVNLTLPKGSIMGLIGENGAGKSTLISLIMHAIPADGGSVEVLGVNHESDDFTELKNDIGVVLDEAYFPEVLNLKNVNKVMKNTYVNWDEKCFFQYMKKFSLPEKKEFQHYSKGMKMKLAIAVALSHNPRLLIFDEATSGLDPIVRDEILDILNDFTRDENHSVLLSSHIVSDLEKICDYIAFLHKGKLMFCEEKDRLLEEYVLVKLTEEQFQDIPEEAVVGMRKRSFGVEALVERKAIASSISAEPVGIEEIMLFLAKGGEQQ